MQFTEFLWADHGRRKLRNGAVSDALFIHDRLSHNLLRNAHAACMPLQHCNREFCTVLQGGGRCKVHLSESACPCDTTTHSFTCTCTLTQMNFAPSTSLLHYTAVQYEAPYTLLKSHVTIRDHVVRCRGSQECGSRFVNFACQFHWRWHSFRITLKSTTLLFMRSSNVWTTKPWQRS